MSEVVTEPVVEPVVDPAATGPSDGAAAVVPPVAPSDAAPALPGEEAYEGTDIPPEKFAEKLKSLNAEHKTYRETYQPYADAFDGLNAEDSQAILGWVNTLKSDPSSAAKWMRDAADILDPAKAEPTKGEPAPDDDGEVDIAKLVEEKLKAALEERDTKSDLDKRVATINDEATKAGFPPGHALYPALLTAAQDSKEPDVAKAIAGAAEKIKAEAATMLGVEAKPAPNGTTAPDGGTQGPGAGEGPKTMKEAEKSAKSRIDAMFRSAASD